MDCGCGEAEFEVLKASDNSMTVQCVECGAVRNMPPPRIRMTEVKVVISHEGEAQSDRIEANVGDEVEVGNEFEMNGHRMIVTGIEIEGANAEKAKAEDIKVLHAKVFDTVPLRISVNEGETTKSYRLDVDPDQPIAIGEIFRVETGKTGKVCVKTIKSDQNRTLHRGVLPARNVVRVFCDRVWRGKAGEIVETRRRGAPLSRKGQAPTSRVKGKRMGAGKRR